MSAIPITLLHFLAITLLTLFSFFTAESRALSAAEGGAWVAPTGWVDAEGLWAEVPLSFDGSSASYAADQSNRVVAIRVHPPDSDWPNERDVSLL